MQDVFQSIPGNDAIKTYLKNMVQKNAIGNSLLFAGPQKAFKAEFALALAKLLMGEENNQRIDQNTHPDLHIYRPEGKIGMHSIASMRQFCEEVNMPPFENKWKIFIIHDADRMLSYSANALLKTFEEPAYDSVIILLSSNPSALLPTVLSRCRTIRFQPVSLEEQVEDNPLRKEVIEILIQGKLNTYTDLSKTASRLADSIAELQEQEIKVLKEESKQNSLEHLNATQKQAIEKELEGAATLHLHGYTKSLMELITSWYRDIHLIKLGGNFDRLVNKDYQTQLLQIAENQSIPSLESVDKSVRSTIQSMERSTALNLCFEKLFLELGLL